MGKKGNADGKGGGAKKKRRRKPARLLAVLARNVQDGPWVLARRTSVMAVFGDCSLDMRQARLSTSKHRVKVVVVLGSAELIVPSEAMVRPSGMALLGGSTVEVPEPDDSEGPSLDIEWSAILGRIRIVA
jgi:hypothetical protein